MIIITFQHAYGSKSACAFLTFALSFIMTLGECRSDEFSCANGRCIDQSLKCNGYNPCGDGSDCPSLHRGYIMAIVFGILALVSLATSTFLAWKLKREKVCLLILSD